MTQVQRDCLKLIVLILIVSAILGELTERFVERGRQIAVAHGCHSPRCVQWEWWFSSTPAQE